MLSLIVIISIFLGILIGWVIGLTQGAKSIWKLWIETAEKFPDDKMSVWSEILKNYKYKL